ncbi:MAG TPA: hypothetical protein VKH34_01265 [Vicinamibacterales bacterium]|nr:hypothetical protein [Vicinamibacterales bacterium]
MTLEQRIVRMLLRLYPAAWRREYGDELTDVLLARPLTLTVVGDVITNGIRLRARAAEPSTILGLAGMLVILAGFVFMGATYGHAWVALMQPSPRTFPPVQVMASGLFVSLLVVCGCWTHLRHGGRARWAGVAAMRMALIAGIPFMIAGLLMMAGLLELTFVGTRLPPPSPWAVVIAPLVRLPEFWIWGAIGGKIGKQIRCWHQRTAATRP